MPYLGARVAILLYVEQAGRGGADARHALGLGQRRQLFGVFGRQGGRLDDEVMDSHGSRIPGRAERGGYFSARRTARTASARAAI
ncbi:Uncharacterised protein [Bordetella pertussis]|nr:Uncharacterised protein [Bordetella pertussis]SUX06723.1 Uncharacterised protein [Bordetella pertussis]